MFPWNLFPFDENMQKMMKQMNPSDLEKYTKDMIGKMMPSYMNGSTNQQDIFKGVFSDTSQKNDGFSEYNPTLKYKVFETHEHVFVRLEVLSEDWLKNLKIYHTSNLMIIEHIPHKEDKHTITLPAIVKKKGAQAFYKDGMLEIKIPKSVDMQYSEIDIKEIL